MVKKIFIPVVILLSIGFQSIFASTVTLVNHFPHSIQFVVVNNNYTPNFSEQFTLGQGEQVTSDVLVSGHECDSSPFNSPATYFQGTVGHNQEPLDVFFGVERGCGPAKNADSLVDISGFNDTGIAYSWKNNRENAIVTFCLPQIYRANGNKCD